MISSINVETSPRSFDGLSVESPCWSSHGVYKVRLSVAGTTVHMDARTARQIAHMFEIAAKICDDEVHKEQVETLAADQEKHRHSTVYVSQLLQCSYFYALKWGKKRKLDRAGPTLLWDQASITLLNSELSDSKDETGMRRPKIGRTRWNKKKIRK